MKYLQFIKLNRNSIFNVVTLALIACLGLCNYGLEKEIDKTRSMMYPMMREVMDLSMMMESFVEMAPEEMRRIVIETMKEQEQEGDK
jgi:preprotein translocase subunit SecF